MSLGPDGNQVSRERGTLKIQSHRKDAIAPVRGSGWRALRTRVIAAARVRGYWR
jgi:hypothetical protein